MKKILLIFLAFVALWAGWNFCFSYHLMGLEGFSFFYTMPDFIDLYHEMPKDIIKYIGTFLLQFYAIPAVGPVMHALYPVLIVLCIYVIVRRLSEDSRNLMWIAFLPLPFLIYYQLDDLKLNKILTVLAYAVVAMLLICAATYKKKPFRSMPSFMHNKYLALVVILVSLGASVYTIAKNDKLQWAHEDAAHLEYLAERQEWDEILANVSTKDAARYDFKRRYALLALSEKGLLSEYAFSYGLSSSSDYVFDSPRDPFECKFNTIFYRALGKNNPAAYNLYLYTLQAVSGVTFYWIRTLTDIYLEQKDYLLAKKYMDILSHTSCHGKWLEERQPKLEAIKDAELDYPSPEGRFFTEYFMKDVANLAIHNKTDHKYADYLMCGALADRQSGNFLQVFNVLSPSLYPDGKIPTLYQEALLLLINNNPQLSERYKIDDEVRARYEDFINMINIGRGAQAIRKYAGTYWAYIY